MLAHRSRKSKPGNTLVPTRPDGGIRRARLHTSLPNSNFSSSKFGRGGAGVERSEPPVRRVSGGSLRSTPATRVSRMPNLELLNLGKRGFVARFARVWCGPENPKVLRFRLRHAGRLFHASCLGRHVALKEESVAQGFSMVKMKSTALIRLVSAPPEEETNLTCWKLLARTEALS